MTTNSLDQEMRIEENLVIIDLDCEDWNCAIRKLADRLLAENYIIEEFCNAVTTREHQYPTGLATEVPVAIPHTDSKYCKIPAIAVGILKYPILFGAMGGGDDVLVEMIFLMSVVNPQMQSKWVRRLVEFFRTPGELSKLKKSKNAIDVVNLLKNHIY